MTARAVIFGCAGTRLSPEEKAFFAEADPWGFILFSRNGQGKPQLKALCDELRHAVGRRAPIFVDQEGGRVERFRGRTWFSFPPALDQCEAVADPVAAMFLRGRLLAHDLMEAGIDGNCAPLGDIAYAQTHAFLRNRCYGTDAVSVTKAARAMTDGLISGGVIPVLKHIPGHGRAAGDSHKIRPRVDTLELELMETDFAPFRALRDMPLGMTAHLTYSAIDPDGPATTSPKMIRLIREKIGFKGLLMTDDLSMGALEGAPEDRARDALAAGCDMILHCNGDLDEMRRVAEVTPTFTATQAKQADAACMLRFGRRDVDIDALKADFDAMLQGGGDRSHG